MQYTIQTDDVSHRILKSRFSSVTSSQFARYRGYRTRLHYSPFYNDTYQQKSSHPWFGIFRWCWDSPYMVMETSIQIGGLHPDRRHPSKSETPSTMVTSAQNSDNFLALQQPSWMVKPHQRHLTNSDMLPGQYHRRPVWILRLLSV